MKTMTYTEAAQFRMLFGKYQGRALDEIATKDQGLSYLGWMRDKLSYENKVLKTLSANMRETLAMLDVYLSDAVIAKDLAGLADREIK